MLELASELSGKFNRLAEIRAKAKEDKRDLSRREAAEVERIKNEAGSCASDSTSTRARCSGTYGRRPAAKQPRTPTHSHVSSASLTGYVSAAVKWYISGGCWSLALALHDPTHLPIEVYYLGGRPKHAYVVDGDTALAHAAAASCGSSVSAQIEPSRSRARQRQSRRSSRSRRRSRYS